MKPYDEIIQYANIDIAVCDIVRKKTSVFLPFFDNFYPFIKENFHKNYDKLLEFSEKKNLEFNSESNMFKTGFYSMRVTIDYNNIIEKLKQAKLIVEIM
jgi:hypothetical protein